MDNKFEYFSNVKDGKLQKNVSQTLAINLKQFEGKRVRIRLEQLKSTRSDQQNRYYWGVVVQYELDCFKERWGEIYTKEQVHDWNKANIFCTEVVEVSTGEIYKIPGTSVVRGKLVFEERMEQIRQFFKDKFEWEIPLPNEQIEANFE